jgi:hypothetical protein
VGQDVQGKAIDISQTGYDIVPWEGQSGTVNTKK